MSHIAISEDQDQLATEEIIQLLYWESVELLQLGKKNWFRNFFLFFYFSLFFDTWWSDDSLYVYW